MVLLASLTRSSATMRAIDQPGHTDAALEGAEGNLAALAAGQRQHGVAVAASDGHVDDPAIGRVAPGQAGVRAYPQIAVMVEQQGADLVGARPAGRVGAARIVADAGHAAAGRIDVIEAGHRAYPYAALVVAGDGADQRAAQALRAGRIAHEALVQLVVHGHAIGGGAYPQPA